MECRLCLSVQLAKFWQSVGESWKPPKALTPPPHPTHELPHHYSQSPNFKTFLEPKNQFRGINSASLCSNAGQYDNLIPTRFLAPINV